MTLATPFSKLLVANRGEIALRVMRSARALGCRTVAVYSTADARARHALEADQAVWIGDALPSQSYLNIGAIIDAARLSGADAVHPGYGFLAENAAFAQACRDAGLVFVGPSPQAIAALGDKAAAKRLMLKAGVPCVPGELGEDQSADGLAAQAGRIGYPVMVKATAGGGGRGMRLVAAPQDFAAALGSAQSEALNAFGDATVILERAIAEPRHIEIQVFADRHGNAIHLGERDCSVQRRHQKLIEESPSPAVTPQLRTAMGAAAVAAVRAIEYEGAGTLEFLLDRDGNFYFMEMNTRLQVEHPVTEAVTGLDLVALQLRVAAGEPLPLQQHDVQFNGHAIEVRLCAEDADQGFLPQSGTMALWRPADGLRVEHAMASGATVAPFYDSMIAKLVCHAATRDQARRQLLRGLQDSLALGVKTNQAFLARCLGHPVFAAGEASTAFIGRHLAELLQRDAAADLRATLLGALLLATGGNADACDQAGNRAGNRAGNQASDQASAGRALRHTLAMGLRCTIDGKPFAATVEMAAARGCHITLDGSSHALDIVALGAHDVRFVCDGVMESAAWLRDGPRLLLCLRGQPHELVDHSRSAAVRGGSAGATDGTLRATTTGRVVAVFVALGDRVQAGQPMLTLEAMKMEHAHLSPAAGTVAALHAAVGEQVAAGRVLAEIADNTAAATG